MVNELLISGIGFKRAGWESACGELAFAWRRACLVVRVRNANAMGKDFSPLSLTPQVGLGRINRAAAK